MKKITVFFFLSENAQILEVKFSIYLKRRVSVMYSQEEKYNPADSNVLAVRTLLTSFTYVKLSLMYPFVPGSRYFPHTS